MVPGAGLEPARNIIPRDFKSLVSTNFTTRASGCFSAKVSGVEPDAALQRLEAEPGVEPR